MPIALSRDDTADLVLRSDQGKPEAERPTFLFYFLTRGDLRKVQAWREEAEKAETTEAAEALVDKIIRLGLAGWRNMRDRAGNEIPFSPDAIDDVCTLTEKMELAVFYPHVVDDAEAAKKKRPSESPSGSATAEPAPDAPAAASTRRRRPAR